MQTKLISEMFHQEKTYWWHVAKRKIVERAILKNNYRGESRLLDAGCGTGAFLDDMKPYFIRLYGADVSLESLKYSKQRGIKNLKMVDFEEKLPYSDNYFEVITCLDVLEHVNNDRKLIREFKRILVSGGTLYLTIPAYQKLWTYWDEILGHKRRYRKSELLAILRSEGFTIKSASYFYSFLLPIAIIFRLGKAIFSKRGSDFVALPPILNNVLLAMCQLERYAMSLFPIPFGLSIFIMASKK